ncbi:MAG: HEAT repeat domain-containing protein [Bryobacteraceae bacterium]
MAKPNPLDRRLAALYSVEDDRDSAAAKLPAFLRDKSSIIVAKAANMAVRLEAAELVPDLVLAFTPILKSDTGCVASVAIVKALISFDAAAAEVYLTGLRHVQWEPSFGKSVEVAGELRGLCARGLARMGHPDTLPAILPLLADTVPARVGAVKAISESGKPEGELLLRLHVIRGDNDAEVIAECFAALLAIAPQRSLAFVAQYLSSGADEMAEMAALALGETRMTDAFPVLRDTLLGTPGGSVRRAVLLAMAMLRRDEAFDYLVATLDRNPNEVIQALAIHKGNAALRERVAAKLKELESARLNELFEREWS